MFDETPLLRVNDATALNDALARLSKARVIGIDTESDSFYSYQEKVCLIQISDLEADYVIDPLAVKDLSGLGAILADERVVKILHGADYDVVCLKRDFGFEINNLFDTLIAAQFLGFDRIGLADLIHRFFGIEIDKKYQRHDWSERPLLPDHIEYARGDTHFLLALREILIRKLDGSGRMRHMLEECAIVARREWQGRRFDPNGYLEIKNARTLDTEGLRVLRRLWQFRDDEARRMDRPVFKVIPDAVLLDVARIRPSSSAALDKALTGKAALKRRYGSGLLEAVTQGLADTEPVEAPRKKPAKPRGPKPRLRGKVAERAIAELKQWRNDLVERTAELSPFNVASNGVLQAIATLRPRDLDELREIPEVRSWQVDDFGEQILAVLDRVDPR